MKFTRTSIHFTAKFVNEHFETAAILREVAKFMFYKKPTECIDVWADCSLCEGRKDKHVDVEQFHKLDSYCVIVIFMKEEYVYKAPNVVTTISCVSMHFYYT